MGAGVLAGHITAASDGSGGGSAGFLLFALIGFVLTILPLWVLFTKAGRPGWAAIIPIYNLYVLLKVVNRPGWWLILFLIPIVNFVIWIIVALDLANVFGHGVGFAIGLIFLTWIFLMIIAFSGDRYQGAGAGGGSPAAA